MEFLQNIIFSCCTPALPVSLAYITHSKAKETGAEYDTKDINWLKTKTFFEQILTFMPSIFQEQFLYLHFTPSNKLFEQLLVRNMY